MPNEPVTSRFVSPLSTAKVYPNRPDKPIAPLAYLCLWLVNQFPGYESCVPLCDVSEKQDQTSVDFLSEEAQ